MADKDYLNNLLRKAGLEANLTKLAENRTERKKSSLSIMGHLFLIEEESHGAVEGRSPLKLGIG